MRTTALVLACASLCLQALAAGAAGPGPTPAYRVKAADGSALPEYRIPPDAQIDRHPNAAEIRYGQRLLNDTKRLLPDHVGAAMNCNSCHIAQGKQPLGANYINTVNSFPQMNPRAAKVVSLEQRINGCFMRSMNGKPLPVDSREMKAMIAYMKWLAQDMPHGARADIASTGKIDESLVPDPVRGQRIYAEQCAVCHGANGEGQKDARGHVVFPPLWGDESFNIGAGLARTYKAAAFVKYNMPMGAGRNPPWGQGGTLSDQDAVDVSEYFTHMPRPDFPAKANDWPNGKKPKDARY